MPGNIGENMAKQTFSEIRVKASAINGQLLGFSGYGVMDSFGGYGMMDYKYTGYMRNGIFYTYNGTGYHIPGGILHNYSLAFVIIDIVLGALVGLAIAAAYNWTLTLDKR